MNAQTKIITTDELKAVSEKNEDRLQLHDALHYLGKLGESDGITIIIPTQGDDVQEVYVSQAEDPILFSAVAGHIIQATEKIEGEIRALGVEPSDWTPPDDDSEDDDGGEGGSDGR